MAWPENGRSGRWEYRGQPGNQPAVPVVSPSVVLPSRTVGTDQMSVNLNQYHHPFSWQENQLENIAIAQDPTKLNSLNLVCSAHEKTEMDNSFPSLLSGPSHCLRNGQSQPPNTRYEVSLNDPPVCDSCDIVTNGGPRVPLPHAAAMIDFDSHLMGKKFDGLPFASRQWSQSMYNQPLTLHDSLQTTPFLYSSDSSKPDGQQTFYGNGTAVGLPSLIKGTNVKHFKASMSPSGLKSQFQLNKVSEMKSINSNHTSAYETGTLRVFCMKTVGELFLNEEGILVVICFCHRLHMSVAKFSKHSGSLLSNPGEAIHLESGQTIAQWRRIFYMQAGIKVIDDDGGWDWPDCMSSPSGVVGSKHNNKLQAVHIENSQPQKLLSVSGGFEKNTDSFLYIKQPDLRNAALEELSNEASGDTSQKNLLNRHNSFLACSNVSTCGSALQPSNNRMMQEMKEDHSYGDLWMSKCDLVSNKGKSNISHQFCGYCVENINRGVGNQSLLPNYSICNDIVPGSITSTSDFELSLGHPFYQSGTFAGPTAYIQRQQSEQVFNSNNKLALFPSVTKETLHHRWNGPTERSIYDRNLLQHGSIGAADSSVPQEFNNELSKSSPLSLFLSHLNTFGSNTSSQVADSIHNSYESSVPELPHVDSYTECLTTNVPKRSNDELERTLEMIRTDNPCPGNNGKGIIACHADGSYALSRLDSFVEMNKAEMRRPSEAIDKHSLHRSSAVISCHASNYLNHHPEIQVKVTDARHPDESGEIFSTKHDDQEHSLPKLRETLLSSSGVTSFHQASNTPSLNSIYISNGTPPCSTKRSFDASHMSNFSHQKYGSSSLDTSPHQEIECCPLAVERHRMNSQEDPRSLVELRQCCRCFKQDNSQATAKVLQCLDCHSTNTIQIIEKLGTSVLDASCCHTSYATRSPLCSRGHHIQCKLRCDEPILLRPEMMKNNCINSIQHETSNLKDQSSICGMCKCHNICNGKEHKNNFCGRCGWHTNPMCLLECCYSQEGSNYNQTRQHTVSGSMEMLQSPPLTTEGIEQDAIAFNGCGGLKEHIFTNKDYHLTTWQDVAGNMVGNSNFSCIEKTGHNLQATNITKGQETNIDFKESDEGSMEAEGDKEDEISNVCSECSGRRTSSDINISASCSGGSSNSRMAHDLVDEESAIERCGSSGMSFNSRNWDKPLRANGKVLCRKDGASYQSSIDLRNMLKFHCPSKYRKLRTHLEISSMQKAEKKQMLTTNMEKIDASKHDSVHSPVDCDMPYCSDQAEQQFSFQGMVLNCHPEYGNKNVSLCASKESKLKRQQSSSSYNKISPSKRPIKHNELLGNDYLQLAIDCSLDDFPSKKIKKASYDAKHFSNTEWNDGHERPIKHTRCMSLCGTEKLNCHGTKHCKMELRPVACGEYGVIAIGDLSAQSRPPKIVSLSSILKKARKRTILESEHELTQPSKLVVKKTRNNGNYNNFFMMEKKDEGNDLDNDVISSSQTDKDFISARISTEKSSILDIERNNDGVKASSDVCFGLSNRKIKKRSKEIRKRSLNELIGIVKGPSCKSSSFARKSQTNLKCEVLRSSGRLVNAQIRQDHESCPSQINTGNFPCKGRKRPPTLSNSDAFCCVCGSSNKDEINHLMECKQCCIKVHQACYGILKVPKGFWYCRPCRANSRNIVCVLCGYEGGAMTRAVRGWKIVKSLLKAWKVEKISKPFMEVLSSENGKDDLAISPKLIELLLSNEHCSDSIARPGIVETSSNNSQKVDLPKFSSAIEQLKTLSSFGVQNSVTAGMLDSSVTQWVHMVCGLWTPGTQCTNVNTMSAFDVSCAVTSRKNMVCSICNRPGGSCMQCRVVNCVAYFHPWCAHQKGLLQSEIEGVNDEKVGFYGRCTLHASHQSVEADSCSMDAEAERPRKKEFSCARTEGYKGKKKQNGFILDFLKKSDENGGCIVSQEQMNSWLYINAQKLCAKRIKKQPVASSTETDCLREYTRYKQVKGWKQLVVYKSGIHALGLYTSLFISRGAMVVEYVGEIVRLHVADKREIEYQSGKKLQYKSACYFFRIDKDHIIDATRKSGIARFVNHSCLPNCVAKVISVRNEKKVVFFAERDINAGEEITYDYNFNREDEGKKIPCFCNSKNCRRYLN